ncbi:helix-turn-helix domain-containing protein [Vallitalea guaymasensis]|uniref:helix-turn-helix domain-containing protein n=1 Tax=Vallitalea guaymasensis TaxID=1185412 RepID=UPI000DE2F953|nr:helix-turn-helix transcriptional regulator [Vallitalea guaymasensis]
MAEESIWARRGKLIKNARETKGLFQKDIAKFLDVKPNTVSSYESGVRKMDFDTIRDLCKLLDININIF